VLGGVGPGEGRAPDQRVVESGLAVAT
jgi:hypothetical protein